MASTRSPLMLREAEAMRTSHQHAEHDFERPISNGPNARARDEPIGQTEVGLPDDSSKPVEITPDEETEIAEKILGPK